MGSLCCCSMFCWVVDPNLTHPISQTRHDRRRLPPAFLLAQCIQDAFEALHFECNITVRFRISAPSLPSLSLPSAFGYALRVSLASHPRLICGVGHGYVCSLWTRPKIVVEPVIPRASQLTRLVHFSSWSSFRSDLSNGLTLPSSPPIGVFPLSTGSQATANNRGVP